MIWATRINGSEVVINADLIESIEPTPDSVVTLVDGKKFIVAESAEELIARVMHFRAAMLRVSTDLAGIESAITRPTASARPPAAEDNVVRLATQEDPH